MVLEKNGEDQLNLSCGGGGEILHSVKEERNILRRIKEKES
jgi:hypothetical protein